MADGVFIDDQPILFDYDQSVEKFVAARFPESRWPTAQDRLDHKFTADPFRGTDSARFDLPYPDVPAPRLNEIVIPTGASRYGRGLFLLGREQMAAVAAKMWGYSGDLTEDLSGKKWGLSDNPAVLTFRYKGSDVKEFQWEVFGISPIAVIKKNNSDQLKNQMWILPVVDARYKASKTELNRSLGRSEYTWYDLFLDLGTDEYDAGFAVATRIDFAPNFDGFAYPDLPSLDIKGLTLGVAIDSFALSIGCRFAPGYEKESKSFGGYIYSADREANLETPRSNIWAGSVAATSIRQRAIRFFARGVKDHSILCSEYFEELHRLEPFSNDKWENMPVIHTSFFVKQFTKEVAGGTEKRVVTESESLRIFQKATQNIAKEIAKWPNGSYFISSPGIAVDQRSISPQWDYVSIRASGMDGIDAISTHIQSLPPNFMPLVCLIQDESVYIHPTDTATFTLLTDEDDEGWAYASISPSESDYFGDDQRHVFIKVHKPDCLAKLKECDQVLAHYQCQKNPSEDPFLDWDDFAAWTVDAFQQKLHAWEVEATLDESLDGLTPYGSAELVKVRSVFPHVLEPEGIDEDNRKIQFHNPWKVDGICGSPVILQLVTDKCRPPTDEDGYQINSCGYSSDPEPRWEIKEAARRKARYILFQYTGGTPEILDYWYGEDPESCGDIVNVVYPLGEPCEPCPVFASYDPHSGVYLAHATRSAMLGEPTEMDVLNSVSYDDSSCGVNYTRQSMLTFPCGSEPEFGTTEPELGELNVVTNAYLVPPVPACEGYAEYTWNPATTQWELTTPCASGCESTAPTTPPVDPLNPATVTSPCTNPDNSPPSPGYLAFSRASILVCGYTTISPTTIQLAECEPEPGY